MEITFETLPKAVALLFDKIDNVERLLLTKGDITEKKPEELLTVQQAALFLSLSVPTIYGLVSRSKIPFNKKGKRLYFSKHNLVEWVKDSPECKLNIQEVPHA